MTSKIPRATVSFLAITAFFTGLQFGFPNLLSEMERTPAALSSHQFWRLITPIFINRGGWLEITFNFSCLIVLGVIAERLWGSRRWLIFYLSGGFVGEVAGLAWKPFGAGTSVAVFGLLGALSVWLLFRVKTWQARCGGTILLIWSLVLTGSRNLHGPPLMAGACIAGVMLWREASGFSRAGP